MYLSWSDSLVAVYCLVLFVQRDPALRIIGVLNRLIYWNFAPYIVFSTYCNYLLKLVKQSSYGILLCIEATAISNYAYMGSPSHWTMVCWASGLHNCIVKYPFISILKNHVLPTENILRGWLALKLEHSTCQDRNPSILYGILKLHKH